MGCDNKIEHNCGSIIYATCVRYENSVSLNSELTAGCTNVDKALLDIYKQLDSISGDIDLSTIESTCINFVSPKTLQSVLAQICQKICDLSGVVETQTTLIETLQAQIIDIQANPCN